MLNILRLGARSRLSWAMLVAALAVAPALALAPARAAEVRARPAYDFVNSVGVATHFFWAGSTYENRYPVLKAALVELGIHHVRFGLREGLGGVTDAMYARVRDLWQTAGIRSTIIMDGRVGTSHTDLLDDATIPQLLAEIRTNIGAGPVEALEGPNEYNLLWRLLGYPDWASDLDRYQGKLYGGVKQDPLLKNIPVLAPGLSPDEPEIYAELGNQSAQSDAGVAHVYSNRSPLSTALDRYLPRVRILNPAGPIWVTEYGWHNASNSTKWYVNERVKAKYLTRGMVDILSRPGLPRGFIYQLADHIDDPQKLSAQGWFGLLDYQLNRKPSFYAVRNMMHTLCDGKPVGPRQTLKYTLSGELADVRSLLLQKNSGAFYLLLWLDVQSFSHPQAQELDIPARPVRLTFQQPVRSGRVYLPLDAAHDGKQGRTPVSTFVGSSVSLDVPDHVMIVEIFPRSVATTPIGRSCDFPAS